MCHLGLNCQETLPNSLLSYHSELISGDNISFVYSIYNYYIYEVYCVSGAIITPGMQNMVVNLTVSSSGSSQLNREERAYINNNINK